MLNRTLGRRGLLLGFSVTALGGVLAACAPAAAPTNTPAPAKPTEAPKPAAVAPTTAPAPAATKPAAAAPAAPTTAPAPAAPTTAPAPAATKPAAAAPAAAPAAGTVKILYWQAPTILNPHLAVGTKDGHAASIFGEPLVSYDPQGNLIPVLAAEVPSKANGGISEDGKTITYKLKKDVKWADGQPFTANDVVFTWQFSVNKETASTSYSTYSAIDKVEAVDPNTVKLTFKAPNPGWFVPFGGGEGGGSVLPAHALKDFMGAKAKDAPWNQKPFGTGAYVVDDFKSGDIVIYKKNPNYRDAAKVGFERIEMKGGGDAPSAARAIFQTGEYDFAWNLQVEAAVLEQIQSGGKGKLLTIGGIGVEQILFNFADPNKEIDGEKSSPKSKHPFLSDKRVRQAMAMAIDKQTMAKQLYGPTGDATANILTTPNAFASKNTKDVFSIEQANKILDDAGYKKGSDGIRVTPEGVKMKVTYATSINSLRQKEQALVKDGWQKIGIETELKSIDAGVFFDAKPGNPDNINHFYWDVMMFTSTFTSPNPTSYMEGWYAGDPARDFSQKSNDWSGSNRQKFQNAEYNKLFEQARAELDQAKLIDLYHKMNDIIVNEYVAIPLIDRKRVSAHSNRIKGPQLIQFASDVWNVQSWGLA